MTRITRRPLRQRRDGFILIALMVFIAVAMMLALAWLKTAALERRTFRTLQQRAQAEWLVESAIDRAAARLAANPDYEGETWKLSQADMGGLDAGEALITVETVAENQNVRRVSVQADYPIDIQRRNRRTKSINIPIAPGASS
jgi:type II secretory pathway pseudopilin PulG